MELVPLHPDFGVEMRGVGLLDVASSDADYQAVRAAFEEHSLLLFRDQQVADDLQAVFPEHSDLWSGSRLAPKAPVLSTVA